MSTPRGPGPTVHGLVQKTHPRGALRLHERRCDPSTCLEGPLVPGAAWPGRTATVCDQSEDSWTSDKPQNKARGQDAWGAIMSPRKTGRGRQQRPGARIRAAGGRKGSPRSGTGPASRKQLRPGPREGWGGGTLETLGPRKESQHCRGTWVPMRSPTPSTKAHIHSQARALRELGGTHLPWPGPGSVPRHTWVPA